MESLLSAVMYINTPDSREIVNFLGRVYGTVNNIITSRVCSAADPEEQPHVSGRRVRVSVASVVRQPNVQGGYIGGDARVRHHQSQAGIVSVYIHIIYMCVY